MKRVLFLCTGNSCRSQMAEGFLREIGKGEVEAQSAGTFPKDQVHPMAIKVMDEKGISLKSQQPKSLEPFLSEKWDWVITVCDNAKDACPVFPKQEQQLHWSFEDPAEAQGSDEEKLKVFRRIRDEIEEKINSLLTHQPKKGN